MVQKLTLREHQKSVVREVSADRVLLHLPTDFGKTRIGVYLASKFSSVLVLAPLVSVVEQWRTTLQMFGVQHAEVYCTNTFYNLTKTTKRYAYDAILVDEDHLKSAMTAYILKRVSHNFLLGMTASPTDDITARYDQIIYRNVLKAITVYPVFLDYKPTLFYTYLPEIGKTFDYGKMLASIVSNQKRLSQCAGIIYRTLVETRQRTLVLVKNVCTVKALATLIPRVALAEALRARRRLRRLAPRSAATKRRCVKKRLRRILRAIKRPVAPLRVNVSYGNLPRPGADSRVVVGTYQKIGVGFDDTSFEALVLMDNVKFITQASGRIRHDEYVIVDIVDAGVDDFKSFHRHWLLRKKCYHARGGVIVAEMN